MSRPLAGLTGRNLLHNPPPAALYEWGLREPGTAIASSGALVALSGEKTGRSPADKRIVREPGSEDDVWWGHVNIPLEEESFLANRARAIEHCNTRDRLFVVDGFAGWDPEHRLKVRVISTRAYHALFMQNMLIRPTAEELATFGEPDYTILNAGEADADPRVEGVTSPTSVALHFGRREMVILGTQYAGEMKKGVFTIMHYLMPRRNVLSMHCSANEGPGGEVSIFFGLSGTGKTTLSADPRRRLIGDDEHGWSEGGIFNIEGGCYAKVIDLDPTQEPQIHAAIRFGSVLENVVYDRETRSVDYADASRTENTRCSYPIDFIDHARIPCVGRHPRHVVFLTADAFGVLPPVAKLNPAQAMYHFISGYTAKVAGTEVGVKEPSATFSACFGAPFLVWHPARYAALLAEKLARHGAQTWLVNTGWTGGAYGAGQRMRIAHTRAILEAIHDGSLERAPTRPDPVFGFEVPTTCAGVPQEILDPRQTWSDRESYDAAARRLAVHFQRNFETYEHGTAPEVKAAGPRF